MAAHEWLAVVYFAGLTAAAWFLPLTFRRRLITSSVGFALLLCIVLVAAIAPAPIRAWSPHLYLVSGYWMPALLVSRTPSRRFEEWLVSTDRRIRRLLPPLPRLLVPAVEFGYLFCYPLVPLSFGIVWVMGDQAAATRFWFAVLVSGFGCYVTLPWLVGRPPRLRHTHGGAARGVSRLNKQILGRVSHQLNTFPSGHVAVAAAAAIGAGAVSGRAGAALGAVVAAISVGAAAGGYHYAIDVILGLGIGAAAVFLAGIL
jgi:membrane-associated phospholipid phosphatase